ncbi:hypothetical protein [Carnobacterium funditum]|uniref:hypothetical protein n=1 Tax=Carnobacterium funditum TaxID=2752 RepID=UPI000555146E|nr:hypothetical protein [Carnobacterium funditum]
MRTWITIEGIECTVCSKEVEAELLAAHTVEDVFNGLHKNILFIHMKEGIAKEAFLNSMSRIPKILNQVITQYECTYQCCANIKIDLSLD